MQLYKKQKEGNNRLVLFFNGWGMDEKCISHIYSEDIDVLVFFDYRGDIFLPNIDIAKYKSIYVVAWSMGVWVANQLTDRILSKVDARIAFCGSPFPINNDFGIPTKIFDMTLEGLKISGIDKFFSRMLNGNSESSFQLPDRVFYDQIAELMDLKENSLKSEVKDVKWNKVVIGMRDKIFPSSNLINYWEGKTSVEKSDLPHYPFDEFNTWDKILSI